MTTAQHLNYRPDIDGLRAIAVAAVVIFHAYPSAFPGGFVGVDIFFVISGYLISSIIFKSLSQGEFSFSDFYGRRVRRIFPPLLAVLFASLIAGWWILLPDEYEQLAKHALGGLGFVANMIFWSESGYFDNAAHTKALLHLWSLGVEEQFYILWPAVVFAVWKTRKNLWLALGILGAGSFISNIVSIHTDPSSSYFLLPTRAWEIILGAALALKQHTKPALLDKKRANALGIAGLGLIFTALALIDKNSLFPGWWALLPSMGAVFIIAAGENSLINQKLLATRPMVAAGLISFPLYLWHWPLLSFLRTLQGESASNQAIAITLFIALLLASMSYWMIEKPSRQSRGVWSIILILIATLLVATAATNIYIRDGLSFRFKRALSDAEVAALQWGDKRRKSDTCNPLISPEDGEDCLISQPNRKPDAIIIGDSHANHYYWGLSEVLKERDINLMQLAKSSCGPLYGVDFFTEGKLANCQRFTERAIEFAINTPEIHTVFLGGRWMVYVTGRDLNTQVSDAENGKLFLADIPGKDQPDRQTVFSRGLDETLKRLTSAGKKVVFMHAVPELNFNIRECIAWNPSTLINRLPRPECSIRRTVTENRNNEYRPVLETILSRFPNIEVIDPVPIMCDTKNCWGRRDAQLLYRDDDHLSLGGSIWLAKRMLPAGLDK
ncbi:acyltransferase family protein [Azonexus sp.]|uniref:acyltransferase family protein n=1 Tax=Azonexus sp. TaxID=1872668 RepID=UPI0027BA4C8B|nr:acyltransferase family protein [Azonexus sp.]